MSGLEDGNFVRIAGVEVGKVKKISIQDDGTGWSTFSADDSVVLTEGSRAVIRYENLIGGRYLALRRRPRWHQATQARRHHSAGPDLAGAGSRRADRRLPSVVPCAGSQPGQHFVQRADQGLPGRGRDDRLVLAQTAALTNTLADRDHLIGQVIANLNTVLGSLGDQSTQFAKTVDSLSQLLGTLADRKPDISNSIAYANAAAGSIADLLAQAGRRCRRSSRDATGREASSSPIATTSTICSTHCPTPIRC